jgi:maltose phosphorylase
MLMLYDPKTKLYEQHEGFYDLPHIDVDKIPVRDFPLYEHWSYDRIYRNDMIKQPDVLMFMFLYDQDFTIEEKKANFDYYEPRCIHESSLSPSVHSILAEEIGYESTALKFFSFATRLDLDDYNRNTSEGLHMTSIAAAWMNIVYGFLGLRSDRKLLSLRPKLPVVWTRYSVKLKYKGAVLTFEVAKHKLTIRNEGAKVTVLVYGKKTIIDKECEIDI